MADWEPRWDGPDDVNLDEGEVWTSVDGHQWRRRPEGGWETLIADSQPLVNDQGDVIGAVSASGIVDVTLGDLVIEEREARRRGDEEAVEAVYARKRWRDAHSDDGAREQWILAEQEIVRLRSALQWIRETATIHYIGDAFMPEHMRNIANFAIAALRGDEIADYDEATESAREKAKEMMAFFSLDEDDAQAEAAD